VTAEVRRVALRWHGGKFVLAPWIISHFGEHRTYVEAFGGAFSVGLRKPRSYSEVYNDLDDELVNLFRVLRDEQLGPRLLELLRLTPFARTEFLDAYEPSSCPLELARRMVVRSFMGFGSDGASGEYRTGFRASSNRSGTTAAHDWADYSDALPALIARVRGLTIEHDDALAVMRRHDRPTTLHYVDPPYMKATRTRANRRADSGGVYRHELTDEQHVALLETLLELEGMIVLSGYPSGLYDDALKGWRRVTRFAMADGARQRLEVLWLNPAAAKACPQPCLFDASTLESPTETELAA